MQQTMCSQSVIFIEQQHQRYMRICQICKSLDWPFKPTINTLETLRQPQKSVLTSFPGNSDAQHHLRIALNQGSPTSQGLGTGNHCQISSSIRLEMKYMINVMSLSHFQIIPHPPVCGKLSSMKSIPGTKNVGDCTYTNWACVFD